MRNSSKAPSSYSVYVSIQPCSAFIMTERGIWGTITLENPEEIEYSKWGFFGDLNPGKFPESVHPFFIDNFDGEECRIFVPWDVLSYAVYKCPSEEGEDTLSSLEVSLRDDMQFRTKRGDYDWSKDVQSF